MKSRTDNLVKGRSARASVPKGKKRYGTKIVEDVRLEAFGNRSRDRRYTIDFICPEFTCLCPRSGFADFATIKIKYVPDARCVELKSLKLYLNGYRDLNVYHEDVVNIILEDLVDLLDPWEVEVVGDFNVRGNIKTIITARHQKGTPFLSEKM